MAESFHCCSLRAARALFELFGRSRSHASTVHTQMQHNVRNVREGAVKINSAHGRGGTAPRGTVAGLGPVWPLRTQQHNMARRYSLLYVMKRRPLRWLLPSAMAGMSCAKDAPGVGPSSLQTRTQVLVDEGSKLRLSTLYSFFRALRGQPTDKGPPPRGVDDIMNLFPPVFHQVLRPFQTQLRVTHIVCWVPLPGVRCQ